MYDIGEISIRYCIFSVRMEESLSGIYGSSLKKKV